MQGLEESDLAADLRRVAEPLGIQVLSDPEPERNAFIRSDQYSFIRKGVPALSLKVGFAKDSPEHEVVKRWRKERYHAPSDDLNQPVDLQGAADFGRLYARAVEEIANRAFAPTLERGQLLPALRQPENHFCRSLRQVYPRQAHVYFRSGAGVSLASVKCPWTGPWAASKRRSTW